MKDYDVSSNDKYIYNLFYTAERDKFGMRFTKLFSEIKRIIKKISFSDMNLYWYNILLDLKIIPEPFKLRNKYLHKNFYNDFHYYEQKLFLKIIARMKFDLNRKKAVLFKYKELFIHNFPENTTIASFFHLNKYKIFLEYGNFRTLCNRKKYVCKRFNLNYNIFAKLSNTSYHSMSCMRYSHTSQSSNLNGFINLSNIKPPIHISEFLNRGPKYPIPTNFHDPHNLIAKTDVECAMRDLICQEKSIPIANFSQLSEQQKLDIKRLELKCNNVLDSQISNLSTKENETFVKETRVFLKENNLTVLRADKSNAIVLIEAEKYNQLMLNALVSNNLTESVDSNKTKERKLQNMIRHLRFKGVFNDTDYAQVMPSGSTVPHIFSKIKIHKSPPSLRLIVNASNLFSTGVSSWLINKLNKYVDSSLHVKNSLQVKNELIKINIDQNSCLFSLDVCNMFSFIPVPDVIHYLVHRYKFDKYKDFNMTLDELSDLLTMCANGTPAYYAGKFYSQEKGVSMGNNIASFFAKIAINLIINKIKKRKSLNILGAFIYVDDLLIVGGDPDSGRRTLEFIDTVSKSFKFTIEHENERSIPFLNLKIIRHDSFFDFDLHLKPTCNDIKINFNSTQPMHTKVNTLKMELKLAYSICSTEFFLNRQINRIRNVFFDNGYPIKLINKLIGITNREMLNSHNSRENSNDDTGKIIKKTFKNQIVVKNNRLNKCLRNEINKLKVSNSWKNVDNLYVQSRKPPSIFDTIKDVGKPNRLSLDCSNVVYNMTCITPDCHSNYIGQTKRTIHDRWQQHMLHDVNSSVKAHCKETGHDIVFNSDCIKILNKEICLKRRLVCEAYAIRDLKPNLNHQLHMNLISNM